MSDDLEKRERARRLRRIAMIAGMALGLACNFVPPDYRAACDAITSVAGITCGGN